jgi:glycosyltransferase involved in cell wall biosynthesis
VPALVSTTCGIGGLVSREGAGIATTRNPADVAEAARTLRREHTRFAAAARHVAERYFDVTQFVDAYARLYESTTAAVRHDVSVRADASMSR